MLLRTFSRGIFRARREAYRKPVETAVCIDIECTCDSPLQIDPMELIEIACLKLDLTEPPKQPTDVIKKVTPPSQIASSSVFHSYARPVINPELTLFCQNLTGITQETVNGAEPAPKVLENLKRWMIENGLIDEQSERQRNFAFVSCGNFDVKFLQTQIQDQKLFNNNPDILPIYFKQWINVKRTFVNHKREWPRGLYHMMEMLELEPRGRLHSALDDCVNLARIVEFLHLNGCKFQTNK